MTLKDIFVDAGVQRVHIIDDAYDTKPMVGIGADASQTFIDALDDTSFDRLCLALEMGGVEDSAVVQALADPEIAGKLFDKRDDFGPPAEALFADYLVERAAKLDQVAPLVDFLKSHGLECQTFGADYSVTGSEEPQLVFIDLKLRDEGPLSVSDAVGAFRKLLQTHQQCQPFVFLMSSLSTALPERRDEFRQSANIFASQFEALEKKHFKDVNELEAVFSQYARVLPQLRELHQHVDAVGFAIANASKNVQAILRSLDLADYFVLHRNTVSIEKVGLGTYISDLLLEYLVHEVESTPQIWSYAKGLDAWALENIPRSRFNLSLAAGRIYSGNLLHAEARLDGELERGLGPANGYFYMGDIFFLAKELNEAQPTRALVIATPACDLVRPAELRERTIFLCEGTVKSVTTATVPAGKDGLAAVVMPHPKDPERQLLIKWDKKKLHTWHTDEMDSFASAEGCHWVRAGRLRPLYAIQLQHAITADLSRIGVQRPPNVLVPHGMEAFVRGDTKWIQLDVDERTEPTAAALADSEDGKKTLFIIADPSVRRVRRKLTSWVEKNPTLLAIPLLKKLSEAPQFDQKLMYLAHDIPQKTEDGKLGDIAGYPMLGVDGFSDVEGLGVALVRPGKPSPYVGLTGGQAISDNQRASLVLKLVKI